MYSTFRHESERKNLPIKPTHPRQTELKRSEELYTYLANY